jgi:hypothetical protein
MKEYYGIIIEYCPSISIYRQEKGFNIIKRIIFHKLSHEKKLIYRVGKNIVKNKLECTSENAMFIYEYNLILQTMKRYYKKLENEIFCFEIEDEDEMKIKRNNVSPQVKNKRKKPTFHDSIMKWSTLH